MSKDLNPEKFNEQVDALYNQALEETKELLSQDGEKRFMGIPPSILWSLGMSYNLYAFSTADVPLSIWAIGVMDDGSLKVRANVCNVGYGHSDDDFPNEWTDISEIKKSDYPEIYSAVAANFDNLMNQEEINKLIEEHEGGTEDDA